MWTAIAAAHIRQRNPLQPEFIRGISRNASNFISFSVCGDVCVCENVEE